MLGKKIRASAGGKKREEREVSSEKRQCRCLLRAQTAPEAHEAELRPLQRGLGSTDWAQPHCSSSSWVHQVEGQGRHSTHSIVPKALKTQQVKERADMQPAHLGKGGSELVGYRM